jgi:hypothetical protein
MKCPAFVVGLLVVCAALLLVAPTATVGAAAPTGSNAVTPAPIASRVRATVKQLVSPVAARVSLYVPSPVCELAPPFLQGAVSLVMVGRGARLPPASVNGPAGDEVLLHTTAKFFYAAGAIAAELMLLQLVYREPYRNLRRNPINRFFCSPVGFAFLVLLTAVPNDLVDISLLCVFFWKLSASVYTPAIVCGQLLRVYVAALLPRLPVLSAARACFLAYWGGDASASEEALPYDVVHEAGAEVVLAAAVAGAVLFAAAARRGTGVPAKLRERESDGDDYYEE